MTVDEVPDGVEEADRLGAEMLSGYTPSAIFDHDKLREAYRHVSSGCEPAQCRWASMWESVTANRYLATFFTAEHQRNMLDEHGAIDSATDRTNYMSTWVHLTTGLIPGDDETLVRFNEAIGTWIALRVDDCMAETPDDATGDGLAKSLLFEGFLHGLHVAKMLETLGA